MFYLFLFGYICTVSKQLELLPIIMFNQFNITPFKVSFKKLNQLSTRLKLYKIFFCLIVSCSSNITLASTYPFLFQNTIEILIELVP